MISPARFAWLQLRRQKIRLAVALAGVAFAVVLMFMQLGFQDALYRSALNVPRRLEADVVLLNPRYTYVADSGTIPRRRLYQVTAAGEQALAARPRVATPGTLRRQGAEQ